MVSFKREYQPLPRGIQIPVVPQFFYMPDQILGKSEKTQFSGQNLTIFHGPPLPKYNDIFKIFTHDLTFYVIGLGIAKISGFHKTLFCINLFSILKVVMIQRQQIRFTDFQMC